MTGTNSLFCTDEVLADTDSPVEVNLEAQKYGRNYLFMSDAAKYLIDQQSEDGAAAVTTETADQAVPATPLADESPPCTPILMKRVSTPPPAPRKRKKKAAVARYEHNSCAWHLESEFAPLELRVNRILKF